MSAGVRTSLTRLPALIVTSVESCAGKWQQPIKIDNNNSIAFMVWLNKRTLNLINKSLTEAPGKSFVVFLLLLETNEILQIPGEEKDYIYWCLTNSLTWPDLV